MKNNLTYCFCFLYTLAFSQVRDTIRIQELHEVFVYKDKWNYQLQVEKVRKLYPYALHAATLLKKFDAELAQLDSKRKRKKYNKTAHQELKTDYTYVIRDLYREDGVLLMKLIHRETGLTAAQIIAKYRGKFRSELYDQIGKIWEQNLDVTYDPAGEDYLTEKIIQQIKYDILEFNPEVKYVTKEEYKKNMVQYRKDLKIYRQFKRQHKKKQKQMHKKSE